MKEKKGQGTLYLVIGIATLVVAIIGATFAYFSAQATSADKVQGGTNTDLSTALTLNVNLYIGDGFDGKKYATQTVTVKGVGINETKAYMDALKIFKNSDTWKRFNQFKEYFMLMNDEEKKVLCDVYREIKKSSNTDNKILKQLKYDIQETFDKMCTIIPKIYYYYKEKYSNKEIKKEKVSESRLNRIKKRFNII